MSKASTDLDPLVKESPPGTPAEPGHAEWLRRQLVQAMAELDAPEREKIEHADVFAELDRIIAKHERQ